ncbi:MAG: type II toxin-antitoxin system PemK/MazF family toxin [Steroidobacteraceae bacterium]
MGLQVRRGDVCWYTFPAPNKRRAVLILTRDSAIAVLNSLTVAPITTTIRSIPTEIVLTPDDGLPDTCAANFDNIQTVPKVNISAPITHLSARKMKAAAGAIGFALGLIDSNA